MVLKYFVKLYNSLAQRISIKFEEIKSLQISVHICEKSVVFNRNFIEESLFLDIHVSRNLLCFHVRVKKWFVVFTLICEEEICCVFMHKLLSNFLSLNVHVSEESLVFARARKLYVMFTHKLRIRCVFTRNRRWRTLTFTCTRKKENKCDLTRTRCGGGGWTCRGYSKNEAIKMIIHVHLHM